MVVILLRNLSAALLTLTCILLNQRNSSSLGIHGHLGQCFSKNFSSRGLLLNLPIGTRNLYVYRFPWEHQSLKIIALNFMHKSWGPWTPSPVHSLTSGCFTSPGWELQPTAFVSFLKETDPSGEDLVGSSVGGGEMITWNSPGPQTEGDDAFCQMVLFLSLSIF